MLESMAEARARHE